MSIFNRKTKKKHIEQLENNITELLKSELPQLKVAFDISKPKGIKFNNQQNQILISRGYSVEVYEELELNHKSYFNLKGVSIFNRKSNKYEPISLDYFYNTLSSIRVKDPCYFHKNFDLNDIKASKIKVKNLDDEKSEKSIILGLLEPLKDNELANLELDSSIEIELDGKLYYTILDMEDGNYIAVDEKKQIYRLTHDSIEVTELIAKSPIEFYKLFEGDKHRLD